MIFTKEDYDILTKYGATLYNAKYGDFLRVLPNEEIDALNEQYNKAFPNKVSGIKNGCTRCRLRCIKELANLYFKDKAVYDELEPKDKDTDTQQVARRGRKSATNKEIKKE